MRRVKLCWIYNFLVEIADRPHDRRGYCARAKACEAGPPTMRDFVRRKFTLLNPQGS
jgi:hypothetical protein